MAKKKAARSPRPSRRPVPPAPVVSPAPVPPLIIPPAPAGSFWGWIVVAVLAILLVLVILSIMNVSSGKTQATTMLNIKNGIVEVRNGINKLVDGLTPAAKTGPVGAVASTQPTGATVVVRPGITIQPEMMTPEKVVVPVTIEVRPYVRYAYPPEATFFSSPVSSARPPKVPPK